MEENNLNVAYIKNIQTIYVRLIFKMDYLEKYFINKKNNYIIITFFFKKNIEFRLCLKK